MEQPTAPFSRCTIKFGSLAVGAALAAFKASALLYILR